MDEKANPRRRRVDGERNFAALVNAARVVFATSGVDAPAKQITDAAGLGVGTLYRHFPRRADLIFAVLRQEIDECAQAARELRAEHAPADALRLWVDRYVALVATKRGFAEALHSDDEAFAGLHDQVMDVLEPALEGLLADGRGAGAVNDTIGAREVLYAIGLLCHPVPGEAGDLTRRMIAIFLRGLLPMD